MEDLAKQFGSRLQQIRKSRGFTQSHLAELIGVETVTISRIENGQRFPKKENLLNLARALNVEIRELFTFSKKQTKAQLKKELLSFINNASNEDLKFFKKIICAYYEIY